MDLKELMFSPAFYFLQVAILIGFYYAFKKFIFLYQKDSKTKASIGDKVLVYIGSVIVSFIFSYLIYGNISPERALVLFFMLMLPSFMGIYQGFQIDNLRHKSKNIKTEGIFSIKNISRKNIIIICVIFIVLTFLNPTIYDFRNYLTVNNSMDIGMTKKEVDEVYGYGRTSYYFIFSIYKCRLGHMKEEKYIGFFKTFFKIS